MRTLLVSIIVVITTSTSHAQDVERQEKILTTPKYDKADFHNALKFFAEREDGWKAIVKALKVYEAEVDKAIRDGGGVVPTDGYFRHEACYDLLLTTVAVYGPEIKRKPYKPEWKTRIPDDAIPAMVRVAIQDKLLLKRDIKHYAHLFDFLATRKDPQVRKDLLPALKKYRDDTKSVDEEDLADKLIKKIESAK